MKYSNCHPDRKLYCKNLCQYCYTKEYRKKNYVKCISDSAAWRKANPEKVSNYAVAWRKANLEKIALATAKYSSANPKRALSAFYTWRKANPGKLKALCAKRRAAKLRATPKWADLSAIQLFYINCPKGYEVDHVIPLQGKRVCGLHVLDNLQYLTKSANCSKGNKYGKQ